MPCVFNGCWYIDLFFVDVEIVFSYWRFPLWKPKSVPLLPFFSITLVLEKKGNNGTLFGSITKEEIATTLQEKHNLHIDKKEVDIPTPIKHTGAFAVIIHLGFGINANLAIEVKEL